MTKKIVLFVFAMVLFLPLSATNFVKGNICYEIVDGQTARVVLCQTLADTVLIPESVEYGGRSYTVTAISSHAMHGCKRANVVSIPASCNNVRVSAIVGFPYLERILVDSSNMVYCDIQGILFSHDKTTLLCYPSGRNDSICHIPIGVTTIGDQAFFGCRKLQEIVMPSSLSLIGYAAFAGCRMLSSVRLPESVTAIGRYAFYDCSRLMTIEVDTSHPLTLEAETFGYETIRDGHVLLRERSQEMKKKFQKCGFTHFEYR